MPPPQPAPWIERPLRCSSRAELTDEPPTPWWKLVAAQFDDVLVKMLLAAAFVSFGLALLETEGNRMHAMVEPIVILTILVLNAIVGVWQEMNADAAIEALKVASPRPSPLAPRVSAEQPQTPPRHAGRRSTSRTTRR